MGVIFRVKIYSGDCSEVLGRIPEVDFDVFDRYTRYVLRLTNIGIGNPDTKVVDEKKKYAYGFILYNALSDKNPIKLLI